MPGHQDLLFGRLLDEGGRRLMDAALPGCLDRTRFVHRFAGDVHDAPERALADGDRDRLAGVEHFVAAHEAFGRVHRHRAHRRLAQMLRHFEDQPVAVVVGLQRVQDFRQRPVELHVDDGAHHLGHAADLVAGGLHRSIHGVTFQSIRALRRRR